MDYLKKTKIIVGNPRDMSGQMICEGLILGTIPGCGDYRHIVLIPNPTDWEGDYMIAFADFTEVYPEILYSTSVMGFHSMGGVPQYKRYEGNRLDHFVFSIHEEIKEGWKPELKIISINKSE